MDDPRMTGEESQIIVELYDSYMKTVLRNRSRTLQRRYYKRAGIESVTAEPAEYLTKAAVEDGSSNKSVIEDHGFRCEVNDDRMFEALTALPVNLRLVIVMWYWYSKRTLDCYNKTRHPPTRKGIIKKTRRVKHEQEVHKRV